MNTAFTRTRRTWQAYFTISYYSYLLNSLGPLTPFLQGELGLSYTTASFHFSAYALGVILTGLLLNWAVSRFGAKRLVWIGVFGLAVGTFLLILGRQPAITISGTFLMGLLGVLISAMLSAALVEQHGNHRAIALTESTMMASVLNTIAPVSVSFFARTALTWRAALGIMLFAVPVLWLVYGKENIPAIAAPETQKPKSRKPLPLNYWLYWILILLVEAIEFCIIFWAATYLETVSGMSKANAALATSAFLGSMLVGRILVSRLLQRSHEQRLLIGSLFLAAAGFCLFWLSPGPFFAIIGLMAAGLGIAGLFPILNSLALASVPDRMVEGSANITLAIGLAILLLPLLLGRLADAIGLQSAYSVEILLLGSAIAVALWASRRDSRAAI